MAVRENHSSKSELWIMVDLVDSSYKFSPHFWTSVTILCCRLLPRRLWWNSSVVVRTPVADQLWEIKR